MLFVNVGRQHVENNKQIMINITKEDNKGKTQ